MLSRIILIALFFFLSFCIICHIVVAVYMWNLLWENIEAQNSLKFEFWYRVLIEKHFREQEYYMLVKQMWFLEEQCKVLVETFGFLVDPDWFWKHGYF